MKCEKAMVLISEYIDGNLDRQRADSLEKHLESCTECRSLLADFRKMEQIRRRIAGDG